MENAPHRKRKRGPAAIGDLEVSKVVATSIIEKEREERAAKTAALRALRQARESGLSSNATSTGATAHDT